MKRVLCLGVALCVSTASAGLGAPADARPSLTQLRVTSVLAPYWHVRKELGSGTTVHQYVDRRGEVFAVSWRGPFQPDLRALLGQHFDALRQQPPTAGPLAPLVVRRPDLVIVSGGRMGAFAGRAWLPERLPRGFDPGRLG